MVYCILVSISINTVIQALFVVWLWFRLNKELPPMIECPVAVASAPMKLT